MPYRKVAYKLKARITVLLLSLVSKGGFTESLDNADLSRTVIGGKHGDDQIKRFDGSRMNQILMTSDRC